MEDLLRGGKNHCPGSNQTLWLLGQVGACGSICCLLVATTTNYWVRTTERNLMPNGTLHKSVVYSGLWRTCVEGGSKSKPTYTCSNINYFSHVDKDGLGPTDSILLSLRRATPFPMLGLMLMALSYLAFAMTHCKAPSYRHNIVVVLGACYVAAGLLTLAGIIVYMGAITEESSSKAKPKEDIVPFSFNYGPSLMLALISFVGCQLSGIASINYYISMRNKATKDAKKSIQNMKLARKNERNKSLASRETRENVFKRSDVSSERIYVNLAINGSGELFVYEKSKAGSAKSEVHEKRRIVETEYHAKQGNYPTKTFTSQPLKETRKEKDENNDLERKLMTFSKGVLPLQKYGRFEMTANEKIDKQNKSPNYVYKKNDRTKNPFLESEERLRIDTIKILEEKYKAKKERKERRSFEKRERKKERNPESHNAGDVEFSDPSRAFKSSNPSSHQAPFDNNLPMPDPHTHMHTAFPRDRHTNIDADINSILECPFSEHLSPTQSEDEEAVMKGLSLLDLRRHQGLLLSCTSLSHLFSPYNLPRPSPFTRFSHNFEDQRKPHDAYFAQPPPVHQQQQQRLSPKNNQQRLPENLPPHRKFDKKRNNSYRESTTTNHCMQTHILTDFESSPFINKVNLRRTISSELAATPFFFNSTKDFHLEMSTCSFEKSSPEQPSFSSKDATRLECSGYIIKKKKKITHV